MATANNVYKIIAPFGSLRFMYEPLPNIDSAKCHSQLGHVSQQKYPFYVIRNKKDVIRNILCEK